MDYEKIYNNLIDKAKSRKLCGVYTEKHHITPKCLGGTNDKNNIVELTAKEHYHAHHLLYLIYKGTVFSSKLAHAFWTMVRSSDNQERKYSHRDYERAKLAHIDAMKLLKGNKNHFYGKTHTDESKLRMRNAKLGKIFSEETKHKMSKMRKGVKKTEDHKSKIGRKGYVVIQNKDTLEIKKVFKSEIGTIYDKELWVNPRKLKPEQKYKCSACGIETTPSNLKRWHNEKCGIDRGWVPWDKSIKNLDLYSNIDDLFIIFNTIDKSITFKSFGIKISELIKKSNNIILIEYNNNKKHLINRIIKKFKEGYNPLNDSKWLKFKKEFT